MRTKIYTIILLFFVVFVISCTPRTPSEKEFPSQDALSNVKNMQVEPVAKKLSLSWEKDDNSRIEDGSVPFVHRLKDEKVRLYYCNSKGILSAISSDGLNFVKETGIRVPNLVDPALIRIADKYVLFVASIDERFAKVPKGIYHMESSDGIEFGEPIAVFQEDSVYDPSVLKINENTIRVFYGKVMPPQLPAVESHTGKIIG